MKLTRSFILMLILRVVAHSYPLPVHRDLIEINESPKVYIIENFLTALECDYIISQARPFLERSRVLDDSGRELSMLNNGRTSRGMFFEQSPEDHILRSVQERIAAITQFPVENGETMQVLHYA